MSKWAKRKSRTINGHANYQIAPIKTKTKWTWEKKRHQLPTSLLVYLVFVAAVFAPRWLTADLFADKKQIVAVWKSRAIRLLGPASRVLFVRTSRLQTAIRSRFVSRKMISVCSDVNVSTHFDVLSLLFGCVMCIWCVIWSSLRTVLVNRWPRSQFVLDLGQRTIINWYHICNCNDNRLVCKEQLVERRQR